MTSHRYASPYRPLVACAADGPLAGLLHRAREGQRYAAEIRRRLPAPAGDHVVGTTLEGRTLTVLADSPAWAARLRYLLPDLLRHWPAAGGLPAPAALQVRIAAVPSPRAAPPPRRPEVGPRAAELLLEFAESTPDPALKSIFRRLARRGRSPADPSARG